jgi:TRAP-type C4-dicarboxylate transport system permease small subunit
MKPRPARLIEDPVNLLMWLSCIVGFMMMMHITVDVAGRVLFNNPLVGTIEIVAAYYMVAIAFLPLAYIVGNEGHIVVELFTRGLSPRGLFRLSTFVDIVTFAYMCLFAWQTGIEAVEQTEVGEVWETATGFVAVWPSRWLLPAGCALMAAFLLYRIVRAVRREPRR